MGGSGGEGGGQLPTYLLLICCFLWGLGACCHGRPGLECHSPVAAWLIVSPTWSLVE